MEKEPRENPRKAGYPVVPGDDEVDQVLVGLPRVLPGLAPLETDLGGEVPTLPRHSGLVRHLLGPMQPPQIF